MTVCGGGNICKCFRSIRRDQIRIFDGKINILNYFTVISADIHIVISSFQSFGKIKTASIIRINLKSFRIAVGVLFIKPDTTLFIAGDKGKFSFFSKGETVIMVRVDLSGGERFTQRTQFLCLVDIEIKTASFLIIPFKPNVDIVFTGFKDREAAFGIDPFNTIFGLTIQTGVMPI